MARLLLILPEYPPTVGGMQTHAIHTVRHWRDRHTLRVLTYRAPPPHPNDEARRVLSRLSYWHNVHEIEREAHAFSPDAIYASTVYYGTLAQRLGVPVVSRSVGNDVQRPWIAYPFEHGADMVATPALEDRLYQRFRKLRKPDRLDRLFRDAREQLLTRALAGNAHVFANSDYTRALLEARGYPAARITVVAGGVDVHAFAAIRRARVRRFLCVCRLVPKKGLETLLAAWRKIESPGVELRIVGDGPLRPQLELIAPPSVSFTGRLSHAEIPRQYQWADAFLLPSCEHQQRGGRVDVETMGRVFCEAGAAGIPVVATCTGGIPTVVRHEGNGLLVPPGDVDALAQAIRRLMLDPPLAQRLGACGRERAVREWDWPMVLGRQEEVVEELTGALVSSNSSSNIR